MGIGDEIMALGRAEEFYERTGRRVAICNDIGQPRQMHDAWLGNPAVNQRSGKKIIDGAGARPYILYFKNRKAIFNLNYKARAGTVWLTEEERAWCTIEGPFAVVAPNIKHYASPNKDWGKQRWERVIKDFPVPVYQLCATERERVIRGAKRFHTPTFRHALAVIEQASVVLCNEGGTHHMAASMGTPAVVIFGAFIPPSVTGYDFHTNLAVETEEGFCGNWNPCDHCTKAMALITPSMVRIKAMRILDSAHEKNKSLCRV